MKAKEKLTDHDVQVWEETSGLVDFLAGVPREAEKFDDATGFDISPVVRVPAKIDDSDSALGKVGFVIIRQNRLLPERTYCVYSVLRGRALHGYIGIYRDGCIETVRELKPIQDFRAGTLPLYDWFRALVKASCEKR